MRLLGLAWLLVFPCLAGLASNLPSFFYAPNALIVPKSQEFIQTLSSELKRKSGVGLYVVAVKSCREGLGERVEVLGGREWENEGNKEEKKICRNRLKQAFLSSLQAPYAVLFFFQDHRKIDLILEPKLEIDTDAIIAQYIVPILTQDKGLSPAKISAALLNGYAQLADEIALAHGVSLEQNLIVDRSGARAFVHYLIYVMLAVMFGVIAFVYFLRRK